MFSVWDKWINMAKTSTADYICHIDEDFIFKNKEEFLNLISYMKDNNIDVAGCADGYNEYRCANPMYMNSFFLVIKREVLNDFKGVRHYPFKKEFLNKFNHYKENVDKFSANFENYQEPYYCFFTDLLDNNRKFHYLYQYFDNELKSTNPRFGKDSKDMGFHMWYSRDYLSDFELFGVKNSDRYKLLNEKFEYFVNV